MGLHADKKNVIAVLLHVAGQVQGVGFRPFVYRLAIEHHLQGWVENHGAEVHLLFQGEAGHIDSAVDAITRQAPPLSRPHIVAKNACPPQLLDGFSIRPSRTDSDTRPHIPPDYFLCDDCLRELNDSGNRRYHYPFINCTQCGPRYTLIEKLPYDRPHTTMASFPLCPACLAEYNDPLNRRFHAEPIACPECGPQLQYRDPQRNITESAAALDAAIARFREGGIVAVKGIGGYHLMCDAANAHSVDTLRQRKKRPDKPLAVMFPQQGTDGLAAVQDALAPTEDEAALLHSALRPIVLCAKRPGSTLAQNLAPGLGEIGAMLPYSPLHHLLLQAFGAPLVATSGNISGEPVLTDNHDAEERLGAIADAFLHHNRPIRRPADDPVYRRTGERVVPLRLGRGNAPLERQLPFRLDTPLLAVGGEMKNSIALAWDDRLVLSPHIGELHSPRAMDVFEQVASELQSLYGVRAECVVHDAHPDYQASRWALASGLPTRAIYHHHAHAAALYGEHWTGQHGEPWLIATWDGVGYGPDGTLWGGEALLGFPGNWQHFARMRPFRLPGGERAGREPWRSALALCLESGVAWPQASAESELLAQAWQRGINAPPTSAVGRLFDAASALLGICTDASFEGQGPMLLEAAAGDCSDVAALPLQRLDSGVWQSDWEPLLSMLMERGYTTEERAARFHHSLAETLLSVALQARREHGINTVGLTGGVFQNRFLASAATARLQQSGFIVRQAKVIPCNDGGLAWGQVFEAASRSN